MIEKYPFQIGELMAGFASVIAQLEQQRTAIDKALTALRDIDGAGPAPIAEALSAPATRKGGMTAEGKERLVAALKKRWAAKKKAAKKAAAVAAPAETASATAAPAKRKGGMTEEGRKKLAEAMKRRWALAKAQGTTPVKAAAKGRKKAA
jgi:hypothetical protein